MNDIVTLLQILAKTPDVEKKLEKVVWIISAEEITYNSYDKLLTIKLDDITALEFKNKRGTKNEQD